MMSDGELRRLARMIVQEQSKSEAWMTAFAKTKAELEKPRKKMVSAKQAAEMIGISVWQLYRIKDDEYGYPQFTYLKGDSQSSPLYFDGDLLVEEYRKFQLRRRMLKAIDNKSPIKYAK